MPDGKVKKTFFLSFLSFKSTCSFVEESKQLVLESKPCIFKLESFVRYLNCGRSGLIIGSLNICHLLPKLVALKLHLSADSASGFFYLTCSETFLNETIIGTSLNIHSFVYRRDDSSGTL